MAILTDIKSQAASLVDQQNHLVLDAVQKKLSQKVKILPTYTSELEFWRDQLRDQYKNSGQASNEKVYTFLFARQALEIRKHTSWRSRGSTGSVSNFDWCCSYFHGVNTIEGMGDSNSEIYFWAKTFQKLLNSSRGISKRWKLVHDELKYEEINDFVCSLRDYYDGFVDKKKGMTPNDMLDALDEHISKAFELWRFDNDIRMGHFDPEATFALTPMT